MDTKKTIQNIKFEKTEGSRTTTYLTHNFHTYPAKFIPQIPLTTIKNLTKEGETVLDPFGGCGTTLVEAKLLNRNAIGVDINPIAVLVSKAKTNKLNATQLQIIPHLLMKVKKDVDNYYNKKKIKIDYVIPEFKNFDHWFKRDVAHELAIIKAYIDEISDINLKEYLWTALSSIIVNVSNQESDTRFAAIEKRVLPLKTFEEFSKKLGQMENRILEFSKRASDSHIKIYEGDARNLDFLKDNSIDHIVTSPPYANTYDYYLYHKFRMFWLGYSLKRAQDNEIGSRNRHSSKKEGIETFEENLLQCLKEMARVLKPKKFAVIVIGDSVIRGQLIKMNSIMEDLSKKAGFEVIRIISYNLSKNSRMFNPKFTNQKKLEHIIFLRNEK